MVNIKIPFGKTFLKKQFPNDKIAGIIESNIEATEYNFDEEAIVKNSLFNPICSDTLTNISKGKNKIVIIASDHTRPVPSKIIMPIILDSIRKENPNADIKILIATGFHRSPTSDELINKFGENICKAEKIIVHDSTDESMLVNIGKLPSGGDLIINKTAVEADLLIAEGFIEPHFFAGFSGGRKSVLPGIASKSTVFYNHCSEFINSNFARSGVLDNNPIHIDMIYAAKKAKLAFIVNVIINSKKQIIASFSGDFDKAHREGCLYLEKFCKKKPFFSDIVITSNNGYPLDQNVYQSVKGMSTAELTCNLGGVIIMVASCDDGIGGEEFYNTFKNNRNVNDILYKINQVPASSTIADQWESQIFARILSKFNVILISNLENDIVEKMHMIPACSIDDAIIKAEKIIKNRNSKITVIPEGISVIIK